MSTMFADAPWHTEEHGMFADSVSKFYDAEVTPNIERWYDAGRVDREFWNKAADVGILGAALPEEHGGAGGPVSFDAVSVYHHARTGDSSWGFGIQSIVGHYIAAYGTEEQKARWLPRMASGEAVGAIAMTEPGTGSDLQNIRTTALKDGNHYVINGSKTFITNGGTANIIIVVAKTDPTARSKGVSLIVIETEELEGFRRGKLLKKIGLKGQDTAELFFDDMRVPQTNLLGLEEGKGFYQLMQQLPWERMMIGLMGLGAVDYALEQTLAYVKDRKAFGQRVWDFQNTRFKLAEIKTKAEVLRSFLSDCIHRLDEGKLDAATASMAKWWGSQVQCDVMDECVQLHGGYGFMAEYPIARMYADARVQKIYGGTNEIMKELIARTMDD